MVPTRTPPSYSAGKVQGTSRPVKILSAADQEHRTRRWRLRYAFLFGLLCTFMGIFLALRQGLDFYAIVYLVAGGFLLMVASGEILGLVRFPVRTTEDSLRLMARRSYLVISLLVMGVGFVVSMVLYPESWPVRLLYVAYVAAFLVGMFAYARWWVRTRAKGSVAKTR